MEEIFRYFPVNISNILRQTIFNNPHIEKDVQEIRIRVQKPIILKLGQADIVIEYIVNQSEIMQK